MNRASGSGIMTRIMNAPDLKGIIAATVLPMTPTFEIDAPALKAYLEWLCSEGVHGVAVNVDTGEGPHLTPAERVLVVQTAAEVVAGRVPVISGLGAMSTAQAIAAATDLKAAGADALLVFPSGAFRGLPLPVEIPVDYYRAIGEGADVPLVLFQLQEALGGIEFPIETLVEIARLDHVVAIKEATFSMERFIDTVQALKDVKITLLTGNDNFIYESFPLGATGALIGFGTLATARQVAMYEAHVAGDRRRAAERGARIQRLADIVFAPPIRNYRARLKEALKMLGVIPSAAIRPPLPAIPDGERDLLRTALQEIGLL
jgi:4-hydroxy-tetrahydrodipicolinate synthase